MPRQPIDMTRHPEYQRRQREKQAARQRQSEQDAELGRQALKAFQEHHGRLVLDDREAIAKNLYWEVEDYYVTHPDEERYLLFKYAGLTDENSTKVYSRLVLKPGESVSTKEGLYAASDKYRLLIETLAHRGGETILST